MRRYGMLLLASLLSSCALQENRAGNEDNVVNQPAPVVNVNVPPVATDDVKAEIRRARDEVKSEVQTSSNNTQSNMSGLINTSMSKIGEKVTGVESKVEASATATANLDAKVTGIDAKVNLNATATANVEAKVNATATAIANVDSRVDAVATMIADLKVEIGKVNATAQVGYNKMEQIEEHVANVAGRDVNYLPKQAVQLMLGIVTALCGLATTVVLVVGRNARVRERLDAERERKNSQHWQEVAMRAIGALDPAQSAQIASMSRSIDPPVVQSTPERVVVFVACLSAIASFSAFIYVMIRMIG